MNEHRDLWWPSPTRELARVVQLEPIDGFHTVHGGRLSRLQTSYECWGRLNDARDNAVLVIHPLASDCHVTGEFVEQPMGWWEPLVGPGRVLDTDRYFVICPNIIGGCYGSSGPGFPADDGEAYAQRFPLLTPLDMMRAQRLFLRELGIERLDTVIGPSMGGMVAWEWAIEGGGAVDRVVVVAAPLRTTAHQIGLNWLQRRGIELDLSGDERAARWGQMVARGVGMMSYRSPIGLEEKFGREWFKPPGATLKDRGMFNVESWLRHHGKRSVRRFDPLTYILFSRAMDLHDVGAGRGGFIAALDRVRCRVLVIGISSDQLYSPDEVHLGADILDHLGKPVAYSEIRSPHGHDAFLLETGQLAEILGGSPLRRPTLLPVSGGRPLGLARLGILGAGRVSGLLLRLLEERRRRLRDDFGLRFEIAAVAEPDETKRLDAVFDGVEILRDPASLVARDDYDVLVDLTRGSGSRALVAEALRRRRPVVTPNKALIREHGAQLERLALEHGVRLAYHNAIAAGWPLLYALERPLGRDGVTSIQALLSSACNAMLESLEQGRSFEEARRRAARAGLSEPDPELHTSGWGTAQKLAMLVARARGVRYSIEQISLRGIDDLDPALVRGAPSLGYRVKLVGVFVGEGQVRILGVLPVAVLADSHLGHLRVDDNVVVLHGSEPGEMVFVGKGTGDLPVASAVLGDLVGLYHPGRSWTGRYPQAERTPVPPEFVSYLSRQAGEVTLTDSPEPGAVPLLESLIYPKSSATGD